MAVALTGWGIRGSWVSPGGHVVPDAVMLVAGLLLLAVMVVWVRRPVASTRTAR